MSGPAPLRRQSAPRVTRKGEYRGFARSALDHLLSDGDHHMRAPSAKVADYDAMARLDP